MQYDAEFAAPTLSHEITSTLCMGSSCANFFAWKGRIIPHTRESKQGQWVGERNDWLGAWAFCERTLLRSYKRVKGRNLTVEERTSMHPCCADSILCWPRDNGVASPFYSIVTTSLNLLPQLVRDGWLVAWGFCG